MMNSADGAAGGGTSRVQAIMLATMTGPSGRERTRMAEYITR